MINPLRRLSYAILCLRLRLCIDPVARRARKQLQENAETFRRDQIRLKAQACVDRERAEAIKRGKFVPMGDRAIITAPLLRPPSWVDAQVEMHPTRAVVEVDEVDMSTEELRVLFMERFNPNSGILGDSRVNNWNETLGARTDTSAIEIDEELQTVFSYFASQRR